jgi:hypothetical protein
VESKKKRKEKKREGLLVCFGLELEKGFMGREENGIKFRNF